MRIRHSTFTGWHAKAGLLLLVGLAAAGCGGGQPRATHPTATVAGVVTYKGQPVSAGTITFYGPNDQVASAMLDPDGSYEARDVPVGVVKITVTTPPPATTAEHVAKTVPHGKRFGVGPPIVPPKEVVSVPPKYRDPSHSGLVFTVAEGTQTHDIELK